MAARRQRTRNVLVFHSIAKTTSKNIPAALTCQSRIEGGVKRSHLTSIPAVRAVVVNVTVALFAFEPSSVTEEGETEHVDA